MAATTGDWYVAGEMVVDTCYHHMVGCNLLGYAGNSPPVPVDAIELAPVGGGLFIAACLF